MIRGFLGDLVVGAVTMFIFIAVICFVCGL